MKKKENLFTHYKIKTMTKQTPAKEVQREVATLQKSGHMSFPEGYDPINAIRQAAFILQELKTKDKKPALTTCDGTSIKDALRKMIAKGLDPDKHQCAFIVRGNKVTLQEQYQGNLMEAKRDAGLVFHQAQVIWKGDEFEYHYNNSGQLVIDKHNSKLDNVTGELSDLVGAYAVLTFQNCHEHIELMSIAQIKKAWSKSSDTQQRVHNDFPDQMARRTVYNRALKLFKDTSSIDFSSAKENVIQEQQDEAPEYEGEVQNYEVPDKDVEVDIDADEETTPPDTDKDSNGKDDVPF